MQQYDRCLNADPSWILVVNGVTGVEGLESLRSPVDTQVKGQARSGAVRHWEGQPLGTAVCIHLALCKGNLQGA